MIVNETDIPANMTTYVPGEIFLPIRSLTRGNRLILPQLPDGLLVVVRAKATIAGLDQYLLIGVSGYQDLHLFR